MDEKRFEAFAANVKYKFLIEQRNNISELVFKACVLQASLNCDDKAQRRVQILLT